MLLIDELEPILQHVVLMAVIHSTTQLLLQQDPMVFQGIQMVLSGVHLPVDVLFRDVLVSLDLAIDEQEAISWASGLEAWAALVAFFVSGDAVGNAFWLKGFSWQEYFTQSSGDEFQGGRHRVLVSNQQEGWEQHHCRAWLAGDPGCP